MANNPITSLFSSAGSFGSRSDNAAGIDELRMKIQSARGCRYFFKFRFYNVGK